MGCDIHTIIQIKKSDNWETIKNNIIEEFNERNYYTFAVLADVRNNFSVKHFEVKGLPNDLGEHLIKFSEDEDDYLNFDCVDYHSHNYITLKEFEEFDYTDYLTTKVKISKDFYNMFLELGGVMPKGIEINTNIEPSDFMAVMQYAFDPYVIASYKSVETDKTPILEGVKKLKEIALQNNITNNENIRIVFCFDN